MSEISYLNFLFLLITSFFGCYFVTKKILDKLLKKITPRTLSREPWQDEMDKCKDYYRGTQFDSETIKKINLRGSPSTVLNHIKVNSGEDV